MKSQSYTLEFSHIGKERNDGTFRVYLRYYQFRNGERKSNYIPSDYYLLKSEIQRLKTGALKGGDIIMSRLPTRLFAAV